MFRWFKKQQSEASAQEQQEAQPQQETQAPNVSPDLPPPLSVAQTAGTHGIDEPADGPVISSLEMVLARETLYTDMFGNQLYVDHELEPLVPHIDVYSFPPNQNGRSWWTIVSGGMCDAPMTVPAEIKGAAYREIILYTHEYDQAYVNLVRYFARYPHRNKSWLGWGHTVTNGTPPSPLFVNSQLNAVLLLTPPLLPDKFLGASFELAADEPVEFLWLVPISDVELDYKLRYGTQALLDIFDRAQHPFVLDPTRLSFH